MNSNHYSFYPDILNFKEIKIKNLPIYIPTRRNVHKKPPGFLIVKLLTDRNKSAHHSTRNHYIFRWVIVNILIFFFSYLPRCIIWKPLIYIIHNSILNSKIRKYTDGYFVKTIELPCICIKKQNRVLWEYAYKKRL